MLNFTVHSLRRILDVHNFLGAGNYGTQNLQPLRMSVAELLLWLVLTGPHYTIRKPQHTSASIEAMWRIDNSSKGTVQYSTI